MPLDAAPPGARATLAGATSPYAREVACRIALLPADAAAADLVEREAGVERDLRGERGEGLGGGVDPGLVAQAGGELGQHLPAGAGVAGVRDGRAQALQAAVGVGDGALLLGVGLGGEDHVGVLRRLVLEHRDGDDEAAAVSASAQRCRPGSRGPGSRWRGSGRLELVVAARPSRIAGRVESGRRLGEARPGAGQHPGLAQAAGVRGVGHLDQAGPVGVEAELARRRRAAPRGRPARRPSRSPQITTVSAGAQHAARAPRPAGGSPRPTGRRSRRARGQRPAGTRRRSPGA